MRLIAPADCSTVLHLPLSLASAVFDNVSTTGSPYFILAGLPNKKGTLQSKIKKKKKQNIISNSKLFACVWGE